MVNGQVIRDQVSTASELATPGKVSTHASGVLATDRQSDKVVNGQVIRDQVSTASELATPGKVSTHASQVQTTDRQSDKVVKMEQKKMLTAGVLTASLAALPAAATVNPVHQGNNTLVSTEQPSLVKTQLLPAQQSTPPPIVIHEAPITIQVTAAPGMDERALAELIRQAIEREKDRQHRDVRGRLYD